MKSFDELMDTNNSQEKMDKLIKAASPKPTVDERFWKITEDKDGGGQAVIRFIPSKNDDIPFVKLLRHYFKKNNQFYIEDSRRSLFNGSNYDEAKDPVYEHCLELFKREETKEEAKRMYPKARYFSNIFVINDPAKPENNGKVFLFSFGKQILDKIELLLNDKTNPINPFHFIEGSDFNIKSTKQGDFPTYIHSSFTNNKTPLLGGDRDRLKEVYEQLHDLSEFTDPSRFKPYEVLNARLNQVLGGSSYNPIPSEDSSDENCSLEEIALNDELPNFDSPVDADTGFDDEINFDDMMKS